MLVHLKPQTDQKVLGLLDLGSLELMMRIGVSDEERATPQKILIKINLDVSHMLTSISDDDINSTICYDTLLNKIYEYVIQKEFKLIETLALEVNSFIKKQFPFIKNSVKVIKWPKVNNLAGSVSFTVSDLENGK